MGDFQLRINDTNHEIQLPDDQIARLLLVNEDNEVSQGFTDRIHMKISPKVRLGPGMVIIVRWALAPY